MRYGSSQTQPALEVLEFSTNNTQRKRYSGLHRVSATYIFDFCIMTNIFPLPSRPHEQRITMMESWVLHKTRDLDIWRLETDKGDIGCGLRTLRYDQPWKRVVLP